MLHPQAETLLRELLDAFQAKYPSADATRIVAVAHFADLSHDGQLRKSGDPYITHPLTVALYCAQSGLDEVTILAALLHDVVEDSGVTLETISEKYGPAVARIIDGVTKAAKGPGETELTYHKLLSRAASDVRVLLIKVFDRLHNLRTLDAMPPEKQKKKARESFLYADIAERLGMWAIATEILDLVLRILYPEQVEALLGRFSAPQLRDEAAEVRQRLSDVLPKHEVQVYWRPLGWFYDRAAGRLRTSEESSSYYDLLVLTEDLKGVYSAFGVIHRQFRVVPGQVLDFVANPKANDYQGLHTMIHLRGRHKVRLMSREMHRRNEDGVLHRFLEQQQALSYYRHYLDMLRQMTEERDLLVDDVMAHLAPRAPILVLTPAGDRIHLPQKATALDFAFSIHTELGLHMSGAVVNGQKVGLDHELKEGDLVEVLTSPEAGPQRSWLEVPVTVLARQAVRRALGRRIRQKASLLGRQLLEPHLEALFEGQRGIDGRVLSKIALPSEGVLEDLLYDGPKVLTRWIALDPVLEALRSLRRADFYAGFCPEVTEHDPFFQVAECCTPLPGESILCELQRAHGGLLHREDCARVVRARSVPARWAFADPVRTMELSMRAKDRAGLVSDILEAFRDLKLSLSSVDARIEGAEGLVSIEAVDVPLSTLASAGPRLRQVQGVTAVRWSLRRAH
jgi:GTP diphosphokinase / guanosine-3',5'-bis(diphosphate) 3'-diphosphatase